MRSKQTLEPWEHYQIIVWYVLAACKKFITPLKILLFDTPVENNPSGYSTSAKFRLRIGLKSTYVLLCGRMSQEVSLTLMKWRGKRWIKQHGEIARSTHDVRYFSKPNDWNRPQSRQKLMPLRLSLYWGRIVQGGHSLSTPKVTNAMSIEKRSVARKLT